jgi:trehalose 6-phosphate synthase
VAAVNERRKLIVVSNRGPVTFSRDDDGTRVARRGGGGLVTALSPLVSHHDVTWIASAMTEEDRTAAQEAEGGAIDEVAGDGSPYRLRFVAHDPAANDWFYNVVSNPTLWFLQHHLWNLPYAPDFDPGLHHAWEDGYLAVNASFADAVRDELDREPQAAVLFHDYHLYVAPKLVRAMRPEAAIAFFIHIPWPATDAWYVLPEPVRRAIHEGLLASDVVGFHADRWRVAFLRSAHDLVGVEVDVEESTAHHDGRLTHVTSRPISVEPSEFDHFAESEEVLERERELAERRPEFLILRVDRTDPSKNVTRGFRAFELFLDAHPELHERVGMLALLDPSRQDIPEYAEYVGAIQRAARAVNDRFQRDGWTPIELSIQDDFPGAVAAYKQYDVLLVNAIFDGLNLVAKEAPLVNDRDGVLVLSENTGAHEELGEWALTVNPFDVAGQADALYEALTLPAEERRARLEAIRSHVREHDLAAWIAGQLADLDRVVLGVAR